MSEYSMDATGAPGQNPQTTTSQVPNQQVPNQQVPNQQTSAPQVPAGAQAGAPVQNAAPQNVGGQNVGGQNAPAQNAPAQDGVAPQGAAVTSGQDVIGAGTPQPQGDNTLQRNPDEWATGDEPMTEAQRSYLDTLARENGEQLPANLTKAEASKQIDRLQKGSPRTQQ